MKNKIQVIHHTTRFNNLISFNYIIKTKSYISKWTTLKKKSGYDNM